MNLRRHSLSRVTSLVRHIALAVAATAAVSSAQSTQPSSSEPKPDFTKGRTLYAIGYAHLDTQWRWTYPQVIREFVANTMRDNFPLFEKYPHYLFNWTGSRRYEMMKEYFPEDYEKVKKYVAAGRWWPAGSSADENDVNMPSGESIIRQVLYGNHFFKTEFGLKSNEYMLPDCFGFPYALPSLLAHCGLKGFNTQKLSWGSAVGIPFNFGVWLGPDGKGVLAALNPGSYTTHVENDLTTDKKWIDRIDANGKASGVFADFMYYGTGDRGGAPDEKSVARVEAAYGQHNDVNVISAATSWIFDAISSEQAKALPHYQGELELTQHSAGSPSSQAQMKRWNRKNELLADAAERASVASACLLGVEYPQKKLNSAWDLVLGSQMHDMMAGTAMPKAYEYCWNDELIAANCFASAECDAITRLAGEMDTRGQGASLVIYNPLSIKREDVVEATVSFPNGAPDSVNVFDRDGKPVPTQVIQNQGNALRLLFIAKVPSVGLATFDVRPSDNASAASTLKVNEKSLENDRYQVSINDDGDISSVIDKAANNKQLLAAPMRLAFMHERPIDYPAWNLDWADQQKPPAAYVDGPAKVQVVENGPVRVALEITREAQGSTFRQTIRLSSGSAGGRVEIADQIDWRSSSSLLKQVFPLTITNPKATYDIQLGAIERTTNDPKKYEVISHQWFDQTQPDNSYGVSILDDSKYGSDKPDDHTLRLSLINSPGVRSNFQDQATQDWGRHEILYALAGHQGDWRGNGGADDTWWQAQRLNQPLRAFAVPTHDGRLGKSLSLFQVDNPRVAISAIKKAEDSDRIIIRLRELTGKPQTATVTCISPIVSAKEVNGQEEQLGTAEITQASLKTTVDGYSLRAFALQLADAKAPSVAVGQRPVAISYDSDVVTASSDLKDGAMDGGGRTYPAEAFPAELATGNVTFKFGSADKGQKNAITCHGQTIPLSAKPGDRVFILAAASDGDAQATFDINGTKTDLTVQDWGGYIGSWDNRRWGGEVLELTYDWKNPLVGLDPGFVKPATVAWFSSHRHNPDSGNEYYNYSYLYRYELALPADAGSEAKLQLPDNSHIRLLAATIVSGLPANAVPLEPLFDTLADHQQAQLAQAPEIHLAAGSDHDVKTVKIAPPLFWQKGATHYTLDSSEPTDHSPTATDDPIYLTETATIKVRSGSGPVAELHVDVNDTTPPSFSEPASAIGDVIRARFSEPVDVASAENPTAYQIDGQPSVTSVKLSSDGLQASLTLKSELAEGRHELTASGIKDRSPAGNTSTEIKTPVTLAEAVYKHDTFTTDGTKDFSELSNLPASATSKWTMNCFIWSDVMIPDRTLIAGFGKPFGTPGCGRYFAKSSKALRLHTVESWKSEPAAVTTFDVGKWQMLTATCDGDTLRFYKDGQFIGERENDVIDDESVVHLAPAGAVKSAGRFSGTIRSFAIWNDQLSDETIKALTHAMPTAPPVSMAP